MRMRFEALCVYCRAGQLPELNMSILMYVILGSATGIKILLFIYCFALKDQSGALLVYAACRRAGSIMCPAPSGVS